MITNTELKEVLVAGFLKVGSFVIKSRAGHAYSLLGVISNFMCPYGLCLVYFVFT